MALNSSYYSNIKVIKSNKEVMIIVTLVRTLLQEPQVLILNDICTK